MTRKLPRNAGQRGFALRALASLAAAAVLASCGGGTDPGPFAPSSVYAGRCASPRSGVDPYTGAAYRDRQGTIEDEKAWLRSWTDELYLWYGEVPDANPAAYPTPLDYFAALKSPALTSSGTPRDRFHFAYPTDYWEALAGSGVEAGYGAQWVLLSRYPPRSLVVAYTEPGSPAEAAGLVRGAQVLAIDGVDLVAGTDVATLNAGLSPATVGETHTFSILDLGASAARTVAMTSAVVQGAPVRAVGSIATGSGPVGYFVFNDHFATAEAALMSAFSELATQGVSDLVIDLRYNGGGYLDIASEAAYMVAGPAVTAGETFEVITFNDKYPGWNPVTGRAIAPTPFHSTALGFSAQAGEPLPSLGLSRVFVLTGSSTCSASEAILNALAGIGVEVVQIGSTTCGKPYGFYAFDNCGTTYFAIQFQGVNAKGFGDYADGFVPGASFPGCSVPDDFTHALGDPAEARLATALRFRDTRTCTPAAAAGGLAKLAPGLSAADGVALKSPWQENRILVW